MAQVNPLTNDEGGLLQAVQMHGSEAYPVAKLSGRWFVTTFRGWKGFPTAFKTKKAAVAQFEAWYALALERWREMKAANPHLMITQYEIRCMDSCPTCKSKGY